MNATNAVKEEKGIFNIDIWRILKELWSKKIVIAVVSILCAVVGTVYGRYTVTPMYKADIMAYVNNNSISLGDATLSFTGARKLLDTYIVILKSRSCMDAVIEKADLPYTRGQLSNMISIAAVGETEVFTVTATAGDPEEARIIADTVAEVLSDLLTKTIRGSVVEIVDYAVKPSSAINSDYSKYTKLGFALGLVASCGVFALLEILNDRIHDESTLAELFDGIPVLANIPHRSSGKRYSSYYSKYGSYSRYGYGKGYGHYGYGYDRQSKGNNEVKTEKTEKAGNGNEQQEK